MGSPPRPSRGQEKMASSIRYQIPLCGIWGMTMSPGWARPRWPSVIPELRLFVGILWWKPPHQLHVNLACLWLYRFGCPAPHTHDKVGLPTHHHHIFSLCLLKSPRLLWSYVLPCIKTFNSFMHAHNHIWAFLACGGAKQSPSNENPPSSSWNPSSVSHHGRSLSSAAPSMQLIRTAGGWEEKVIDAAGFAERKALKLSEKFFLNTLETCVLCIAKPKFPKLCSRRVQSAPSSAFSLLQKSYISFLTHNSNIYTNMYL